MALFILVFLIINNCLFCLLGYEEGNNRVLEIKSTTITSEQSVIFHKVDETLNLTCTFKNESTLPDVVLEWVIQTKTSNRQNQIINRKEANVIVLIIENLQENDSGEYKCKAIHNGTPFSNFESSVTVKVKNKKKECTEVMFQCSPGICIPKRYTCDGFTDCPHGEDELPGYCGPGNPCENKLMCPDSRCIPFTWCCESHREPNCTTKVKHSCCNHVEKLTRDVDHEIGFQFDQQRFSDMGFLQTTVYTVIGCAMAFMFIVTIIVIAICRVHVRRTLLSRCPAASRSLAMGRGTSFHGNNLGGWSIYDLDFYFNRSGANDLMSVNPLLVTYNINNGVQFVGRPIDPPPYCEIVTSPPKEGPPPPYFSQENLCAQSRGKTEQSKTENGTSTTDMEAMESDALLSETSVSGNETVDVLHASEQLSPTDNLNSSEVEDSYIESIPKNSTDDEFSCGSSQYVSGVNKYDRSKNCGVNIIVVGNAGLDNPEALKIQTGESSSFVPESGNDVSKGAIKKLYSTKSLDNTFRPKGKAFPTGQDVKF